MDFTTQYLTWENYKELGGTLPESAFKLLEFEARKKVDRETMGRLINLTSQVDEVKLCINKLIGVKNENKSTIKSESVDGYSVTRMDKKDLEKVVNSIIEECLSDCRLEDGTPYLYRG